MRKILQVVGALMLTTLMASAASIVQVQSIPVSDVPFSQNLNFLQFNGPGTLLSVEIEVTADVAAVFNLSNPFTSPKTIVDAAAMATIVVRDQANSIDVVKAVATGVPVGLPIVLNPGDVVAIGALGSDVDVKTLFPANPLFNDFVGGGSIALPVLGSGMFFTTVEGGDILADNDVNGGATVKVTYNYRVNDVPEPGTWAMMGAGIGLLGLARLRRKA